MASMRAVELFGLAVAPGDEPVPAVADAEYPATFRITMAAIDPTESPSASKAENGASSFVGSTLRIIRLPTEDDSDDEDDLDGLDAQIASDEDDSEDEESDDEDANGGPSDPKKTPKALKAEKLRKELAEETESMEVDDEDGDEDDDGDGPDEAEEFVVCTLDPSKTYQQPLDITINEHEVIYFQATGTHKIYLTGNILIPEESDEESDDDEYDMAPEADEIGFPGMDEDESDELDDMEDPRIVEVDSDGDNAEIPKLVKGKNKRAAREDSDEEQDALNKILKPADKAAVNGDVQQLSKSQLKKQRKKIKDNQGNAIEATVTTTNGPTKEDIGVAVDLKKEQDTKAGKKVQFAKDIIQGPSKSSPKPDQKKEEPVQSNAETKPQVNGVGSGKGTVKVVDGITIDERKAGTGQAAKKGDKVSMRYIGKLEKDKRVFDSNKKGKPFEFRLGTGDVIPGWEIGIAGMAVGGERRITVPPKLAYGNSAKPGIPANSTLVFDVKLLKID